MSTKPTGACLLVLTLVAAAHGQTYTLRIKRYADPGKSVVCKETDTRDLTFKRFTPDGKPVDEGKPSATREVVYTETVLEAGAARPKAYRRAYEKATVTAGGKTLPRSYQGKTVLFRERAGKYEVTLEGGGVLAPADAGELARQADEHDTLNDVVLPKIPVKIGEKWSIPGKGLADALSAGGGQFDAAGSGGEGVLRQVLDKGGRPVGVIDVTLRAALTASQGLKLETPAVMTAKFVLETPIDGSSTAGSLTMTSHMTGKGFTEQQGMKYVVELSNEQTGRRERSAEK